MWLRESRLEFRKRVGNWWNWLGIRQPRIAQILFGSASTPWEEKEVHTLFSLNASIGQFLFIFFISKSILRKAQMDATQVHNEYIKETPT